MSEAIATTAGREWRTAVVLAAAVWIIATGAVILLVPVLTSAPLIVLAPIVVIACLAGGFGVAFGFRRSTAGWRIGAATVVLGQLLDVALILAFGGVYPRADAAGTAALATLLLGGYAAFLAGAIAAGRRTVRAAGSLR